MSQLTGPSWSIGFSHCVFPESSGVDHGKWTVRARRSVVLKWKFAERFVVVRLNLLTSEKRFPLFLPRIVSRTKTHSFWIRLYPFHCETRAIRLLRSRWGCLRTGIINCRLFEMRFKWLHLHFRLLFFIFYFFKLLYFIYFSPQVLILQENIMVFKKK